MNERVAIYIMDDIEFSVYANYESTTDMDKRIVAHWDVFNDKSGKRINEERFMFFPTWHHIFDNYYHQKV